MFMTARMWLAAGSAITPATAMLAIVHRRRFRHVRYAAPRRFQYSAASKPQRAARLPQLQPAARLYAVAVALPLASRWSTSPDSILSSFHGSKALAVPEGFSFCALAALIINNDSRQARISGAEKAPDK